jgi:hypothetical protein
MLVVPSKKLEKYESASWVERFTLIAVRNGLGNGSAQPPAQVNQVDTGFRTTRCGRTGSVVPMSIVPLRLTRRHRLTSW